MIDLPLLFCCVQRVVVVVASLTQELQADSPLDHE